MAAPPQIRRPMRTNGRWKILAGFCGASSHEAGGLGPLQELADIPDIEVHALRNPSLEDVNQAVKTQRPSLLYLSCGIAVISSGAALDDISLQPLRFKDGKGKHKSMDCQQMADGLKDAGLEAIVLDAQVSAEAGKLLHTAAKNVFYWSDARPAPAITAALASKSFFAMLRGESVTAAEAFWVASQAVKVQCLGERKGKAVPPVLPTILSQHVAESPDCLSIPEPTPIQVTGGRTLDLSRGIIAAVPSWPALRLLAPAADVRLLLAAAPTLVDTSRLRCLGQALRSLLVIEVRSAVLTSAVPTEKVPAYLPPSFRAVRCACRTSSGVRFTVTMGGPPEVIQEMAIMEHALRHLLVADALTLAVALPPPGVPAPLARSSEAVAGGTPVIDVLAATSLWATVVLRALAQQHVEGDMAGDEIPPEIQFAQFAVKSGEKPRPIVEMAAEQAAAAAAAETCDELSPSTAQGEGGRAEASTAEPSSRTTAAASAAAARRPPLQSCTEAQFLDDVRGFLCTKRGKVLEPSSFPDAKLNGARLDLYNLYKEVTSRGGLTQGNNINWKAEIFPQLRNWTAVNNMTAVGNTLKRHYQTWLLDYEEAHPEDLVGDICIGCGCGDDGGTDWISCDECTSWMHFGCDERGKTGELGEYKDYTGDTARATSLAFTCSGCNAPKRQRTE